jgi:methylated-DNA-[protein]-cysteine S-methyltransferase
MSLRPPDIDPGHAGRLAARVSAHAATEGLADIAYATIDTPIGRLVAATTPRGLLRLAYEDFNGGVDVILDGLATRISPRIVEAPARLERAERELDEYFSGRRRDFELPLDWSLTTGFTRRVLQACARIPFGATSTYKAMAISAGSPTAFRAAGGALGSNPIPIIVPCHRVLASGGGMGGYTGGLDRKHRLLTLETGQPELAPP